MVTKKASDTSAEKKPNAAFMKAVTPSPELAAIVGSEPIPRTEVTKRVWDYIKQHDLQVPENKRNIKPDPLLAKVFGGPEPKSMFEMTKLISGHLKA